MKAINLLNAIFIILLFFLLDPYILSGGAYIYPLLWLKTVLKFDIIIRIRQMAQLKLNAYIYCPQSSAKSEHSGNKTPNQLLWL